MFDIYKDCDPHDDDAWSMGSLFVWFLLGVVVVVFGIIFLCEQL